MSMGRLIRKMATAGLPESVLQIVRKKHYAKLIASATVENEVDLKLLRHLAGPGQTVVDIGANIGIYTKILSNLVGAAGRVISVEPVPVTFDILRSNVEKLGLKNVQLNNCAASDAESQVTMEIPNWDEGGENLYLSRIVEGGGQGSLRQVKVPAHRMDGLLAGMNVAFIKCDVEGHELSCMRGALTAIKKSMPSLLVEINGNLDEAGSNSFETAKLLSDQGYEIYVFDGMALKKRAAGDKTVNYWFLTPEHAKRIREGAKDISVE